MRSAMRTVENRWEINSAIFPVGQLGEALKNFVFAARIQRCGGFIENQQLRIAEIGSSQRHLLPFSAGEVDPAIKSPPQHLFVMQRQVCQLLRRPCFSQRTA